MSWNLMKLQMYGKYFNPTYDFKDLAVRLPYHVDATVNNYKRHFDTTTGGGQLKFDELYKTGLKAYLTSTAIANRFDFNLKGFGFSDQLKIKNLIYWTGRVIDGPTGIVFTVFPGIWTDIFSQPNFIPAGMQWVNSYQVSQFIQKCTVLGVRIDKMTGIPLPWSGVSFVTIPPPFDTWANVKSALISDFNRSMDLLLAVHLGAQGIPIVEEMKRTYLQLLDAVFTPELLNTFASIGSPYGLDWRDFSQVLTDTFEATSPIVQSMSTVPVACSRVTAAARSACDGFLSQIIPFLETGGVGGPGGISAQGRYGFRKVVFLAGPIGTEDQKAEYILRRFRRDDRRFRTVEEAKENIFYLDLLNKLKEDRDNYQVLYPLHSKIDFEQREIDQIITRVERELKEDEELLLNRETKPFSYITTHEKDTPIVLSDFFPNWFWHYRFSRSAIGSDIDYIRNYPLDINLQLEELDKEYNTYRFFSEEESEWTSYSGIREVEAYRESIGFLERLDDLADSIAILLYDIDRFRDKDIIVDVRNLTAEDRKYLVDKVQEKLPEDVLLNPFIRLFPQPDEDDFSTWDVARVFYNRVLFDPCDPLSEGFPIPGNAQDCHFTGNENFFVGLLGNCTDSLSIFNGSAGSFEELRNQYFKEIYDYDQFVDNGECKQYILITNSRSSVPYAYTSCRDGRLLRNSIVASGNAATAIICSTTKPRLYGPEADIGRPGFCNTCFTEQGPDASDFTLKSIYQVLDTVRVQGQRYQGDPEEVAGEGFRVLTNELEFPYFREE